MSQLEIIKHLLQELKPELTTKFHVGSIGLFGSIVRRNFNSLSDIDNIVDFKKPVGIEFIDLGNFLEFKIQRQVDLVSRKGIKPKYFKEIESEIVYV